MHQDTLVYENEGLTPTWRRGWYPDRKGTDSALRYISKLGATRVVFQDEVPSEIETQARQTIKGFFARGQAPNIQVSARHTTISYDSWVDSSENERTFEELASVWRKETGHLSSITKIVMHPAYQSIIGMGPSVIPLLLRRLQAEPEYWFWALAAITRQNPVRTEDAGDTEKMAEAWIQWAKENGIVF